jgi:hypothetical protein
MMNLDDMKYGESIKIWNVELDGQPQSFRLEHQWWTGEKFYYINDELIEHVESGLLQSASFTKDVPFNIGTHNGKFQYRAVGRIVYFDLIIDGNKIDGEEKNALRFPIWVMALLLLGLLVIGWSSGQFS